MVYNVEVEVEGENGDGAAARAAARGRRRRGAPVLGRHRGGPAERVRRRGLRGRRGRAAGRGSPSSSSAASTSTSSSAATTRAGAGRARSTRSATGALSGASRPGSRGVQRRSRPAEPPARRSRHGGAHRVPDLPVLRGDVRPRGDRARRRGRQGPRRRRRRLLARLPVPEGRGAAGPPRGSRTGCARRCVRGADGELRPASWDEALGVDRRAARRRCSRRTAATRSPSTSATRPRTASPRCSTGACCSRRWARSSIFSASTVDQRPKEISVRADVRRRRCPCRSPTSTARRTC